MHGKVNGGIKVTFQRLSTAAEKGKKKNNEGGPEDSEVEALTQKIRALGQTGGEG